MKATFSPFIRVFTLFFFFQLSSYAQTLTASGPTSFCQGGSVSLSVPLDTNVSYSWLRDTVLIVGQQGNLLVVTSSGNYRVIRSSATNCCDTSNSITVQVNPLPIATISPSGTVTVYCSPDVPTLTTTPIPGATYQWLLNNVPISGATATSYLPQSVGIYRVVVTNSSNCQQSSPTLTIVGGGPPSVPGGFNVTAAVTPCVGQATLSVNPVPGVIEYRWYRNYVLIATTQTTSLVVNSSGDYYVQARWHLACQPIQSNFLPVTLSFPLSTNIQALGSTNLCANDSVTLNSGGAYYSVAWYRNGIFVSGGISANNIRVSTPGTYSCTFSNWPPQSNPCSGSSMNQIAVTRMTGSTATITPLGPTSFCAGDSVILSVPQQTGVTYKWYRNNVLMPLQQSNQIVVRTSGNYTVRGNSSTICIDTSNIILVHVNDLINPTITTNRSSQICENEWVVLSIITGDSVAWYRNDTLITSGAIMRSITVNVPGNYHCVVFNSLPPGSGNAACIGRSANTITVQVRSLPRPTVFANGPTQICENDSLPLSVYVGDFMNWYRNDTLWVSGVNLTTVWAKTPGKYHCFVTLIPPPGSGLASCSGRSVNDIIITQTPQPVAPSISITGNTIFSLQGGDYQWFDDGLLIQGVNDSLLVISHPGVYNTIRTVAGCRSDTSNSIHVTVVGLDRLSAGTIRVYPNPSSAKFYVALNETTQNPIFLRVYTLYGALVQEIETSRDAGSPPLELDFTGRAPGMYMLEVRQGSALSYQRLILNK